MPPATRAQPRTPPSKGRVLREGEFPLDRTHRAVHVLGSRKFGFDQWLFDAPGPGESPDIAATASGDMAAAHPYVSKLVRITA